MFFNRDRNKPLHFTVSNAVEPVMSEKGKEQINKVLRKTYPLNTITPQVYVVFELKTGEYDFFDLGQLNYIQDVKSIVVFEYLYDGSRNILGRIDFNVNYLRVELRE